MIKAPEKTIDKKAVTAWKLTGIIVGFLWYLLLVIPLVAYLNDDASLWIPIVAGVVALALQLTVGLVFPEIRWRHWRYDVSEIGVDMLHGIIVKKRTLVPLNRIQHVDTKQGPIYRKFGLSSLSISTAATTHEIPALDDETAAALRTLISTLVREVKEDV